VKGPTVIGTFPWMSMTIALPRKQAIRITDASTALAIDFPRRIEPVRTGVAS
jgi:hypothetical protein